MNYKIDDQQVLITIDNQLSKESLIIQKEVLIKILATKKPVSLYAKNLTQIDTAVLQLLISFTLAASKNGIEWSWAEPSDSLKKVVKLLGMSELLKLAVPDK